MNEFLSRLVKKDRVALAKIITKIENENSDELIDELFPYTGNAYYIGITGPPGGGKSTLTDCIGKKLLEKGNKIGIIGVDPTSPFTGGALLGDRIRMTSISNNENAFIRSMATRKSLGGLASTTKDVILAMDAFGMDYIIVETVGVGQVEIDVSFACDTIILVLVPESGDGIQALKAGLLEIADIIVINKGDRGGADRIKTDLDFILNMKRQTNSWNYPVIVSVATEGKGIDELIKSIDLHREYLISTGKFNFLRKEKLKHRLKELFEKKMRERLEKYVLKEGELDELSELLYKKKTSPMKVVHSLIDKLTSEIHK